MKLRYFVGVPEDAFRKHDVVFTNIKAADQYSCQTQGDTDTLLVYRATELLLVLDLNDLCDRFDRTYKASAFEFSIYPYFEEFAERLLRFRRMTQKLKEAA